MSRLRRNFSKMLMAMGWEGIKGSAVLLFIAGWFALTIASFTISGLATFFHAAATRIGLSTAVATVKQTADLSEEIRKAKSTNERLSTSNQDLDQRNKDLAKNNQDLDHRNRRLAQSNRRLQNRVAVLDDRSKALRVRHQDLGVKHRMLLDQVAVRKRIAGDGAHRVARRSMRSVARNAASMPLESVPFIGIATIVTLTAWEVHDACQTALDMQEILTTMGLKPMEGVVEKTCNALPLQMIRASQYGRMSISECRQHAVEARAGVLQLAREIREDDPELYDADFDEEAQSAAQREYESVMEICRCIGDLQCDPSKMGSR